LDRSIELLSTAPTQEEQIAVAKNIRLVKTGWTNELEEKYFQWFVKAGAYKGGPSLQNFIRYIKNDAMKRLSAERKKALGPILNARPPSKPPLALSKQLKFVKNWTMEDLKPLLASGLEGGRNFKNGREMFSAAQCYVCHRFNQEGGGIGPDLTSAGGKFSPHDLLESIIQPSKEISDQYGSMVFKLKGNKTISGRIANLSGDSYRIITNLYAPGEMTNVKTKDIVSIDPNPVSQMPMGLLNMLEDEDILDLLAYILSKGDQDNPLFQK
jgi:putative heme-binding domain-containing protein